jgi:ABC-type multidrug transport system fused ATPase/permease subunit
LKSTDHYAQKFGITSYFKLQLPLTAFQFASKLGAMTPYSEIGIFSDLEDIFSSDHRTYIKGMVTDKHFQIKHKAQLFDFGKHSAIINGFINQNSDGIEIIVKVSSLKIIHKIYFVMVGMFLILFLLQALISLVFLDRWVLVLIPFLILFTIFTFLIPILFLRYSTSKMHAYFNGLFVYLAQKNNVPS